jgi:tripartite-type tricarboxylate transporter receptor subunit TctC
MGVIANKHMCSGHHLLVMGRRNAAATRGRSIGVGRILAAAGLAASLWVAPASKAQDAEGFYKGRNINLIVGYGPGGGYDVYGRLIARHIGRYIPGQPSVVVQNMPGAGSLVATNYLYRIAPKDGSVFGTFARNMPLLGLIGSKQSVQFDPMRFTWLGTAASFVNDSYVLLARKSSAVQSVEDLKKPGGQALVIGSTAEGASSDILPTVLRDLLGFNIKAVSGYTDSGQLFLAIDRGEIEGRMAGLSAVRANKPEWLKPDGAMRVLVAVGSKTRHSDYPDVPLARELATGERERRIVEAIELPYQLSRPYAAPPGVPADRARVLQAAFLAVHKDKQLLAEAEKIGIDISPLGAAEVLAIIRSVADTPPDLFKAIEKLIENR